LQKVGARLWIFRIMVTWGIIVILCAFVQTAKDLYILRFLLGAAEAGFVPGIVLYLTYWFRAQDRGKATSAFFVALPLSALIGAPLSTWIIANITWGGMAGWRWMFILEGIPAIVLGIAVLLYLKNRPSDANWLTKEEQIWLEGELTREHEKSAKVNKTSARAMLKDSKVWKLAVFNFGMYVAVNALSFWMPTILKSLSASGTTITQVGWLTMIPSIIAIPAILFVGWNADRTNSHKKHLAVCIIIALIGFIGCANAPSLPMMVLMLSITSAGLYGISGSFYAFLTLFFTESTAPAGIALVNTISSLGGFLGPMIMGLVTLTQGMFIIAGFMLLSLICLVTLKLLKNKQTEMIEGETADVLN
jgi:ACS family tartrate transporter-like MFS transporter